ncbi:hypothetical protein ACTFIY_010847 [Dictyostelium cf. discoideum]
MSLINRKRVLEIADLSKSEKTLQASERYADKFDKWMVDYSKSFENLENNDKISIIIDFFKAIMNDYKGSTLWTISSLLKNHFIKLDVVLDYEILNTLLKARSKGHKPKKAPAFFQESLISFLSHEMNDIDLYKKIVLIVGYFGALRSSEIHSLKRICFYLIMKTDHSSIGQTVIIPFVFGSVNIKNIIDEYFALTSHLKTDAKLFSLFCIRSKKYKNQPMGIHTIQGVPQDIAIHNNLDDPLLYTSHSLRVSAATALAEKGATALQLQNFGGWKSIAVAEGYIRESAKTKKDIALLLSGAPKEDTTKQDATGPFLLGTTEKDSTNQDATDPPADEPKTPTKIKQSFVNTVQSNKTHGPTKIMGNITNKTIYVNNGNGGVVYL